MELKSTLLLNADGTPVSLLPLSSLSWQDAIKARYLDQVTVLHEYEDWKIHSPNQAWPVPAVMLLNKQVHLKRRLSAGGGPSAHMIYLRDDYICQYCSGKFPFSALTKDHVIPRAKNGKTRWENIVTACESCNSRRGTNEKIRPIRVPVRPTYQQLVKNYRHLPITIPHPAWNFYLGWPDNLVRLANRGANFAITEMDEGPQIEDDLLGLIQMEQKV